MHLTLDVADSCSCLLFACRRKVPTTILCTVESRFLKPPSKKNDGLSYQELQKLGVKISV